MDSKERKRFLMEQESVTKAVLKLGLPTMIGMMTSALYNLVDTYFVGSLGTSQTAAVSIAFPLGIILLAIGLLFGAGASSYLARLLGSKRFKEADICFSTALISAIATGGIIIFFMLVFIRPLLYVLGATETVMPYAIEYALPFLLGLMFNVFNISVNNMISAEGATNVSMIAMLIGGCINMFLDPLLIFGFHMGVAGAAVATLISRIISFLIFMYYLLSKKSNFHLSLKNIRPSTALYKEIFKIGIPMLFFQFLCSLAMGITNFQAKAYGDYAVAGIGVANRILSLGGMMVTGFLKGYQSFVGFNYGAGNFNRSKTATKKTLLWSTMFCITTGVIIILFHTEIMHLFTKTDVKMIELGGTVLILNAITFMGTGYMMVNNFQFMALGRAKEGGIISISRQGLFFFPLIFLLPLFFGLRGLLLAQPAADVLTMIMILSMTYKKDFYED
ncbi:MAG: MATE family efflux transporter [Lachnospiraceae bacterium]|nr:MATE family efflux transporter [Lachnospiraceae bacterium]